MKDFQRKWEGKYVVKNSRISGEKDYYRIVKFQSMLWQSMDHIIIEVVKL